MNNAPGDISFFLPSSSVEILYDKPENGHHPDSYISLNYSHFKLSWRGTGKFSISKREVTCVYVCLIHVVVRHKTTQYCKAIIFQLKTNEFLNFSMNFKSMSFLFSFSSYISSAKKNGSKNLNKTELSLGFQTFSYNL